MYPIRVCLVSIFITFLPINVALAAQCQNPKIVEFEEVDFWPGLNPLDGDINADGYSDKLLYNLDGDWLTLEFYLENNAWSKCSPSFALKLLSVENLMEARGWDFNLALNERGSIRIVSCYYGGSRGFCHDDYNLVFRYDDDKVRIIGYDFGYVGINYPTTGISINLLTGKSVATQSPSIMQENSDEVREVVITMDYDEYYFRDGEIITVPEELIEATQLLHEELDR